MTQDPRSRPDYIETVRSEERARLVGTGWVPTERVAVRRRIVTETRQVAVTVRREELVVETAPMPEPLTGQFTPASPGAGRPPLVVTLREEVPVVQLVAQPYERVTVSVDQVRTEREFGTELRRERVQVETIAGPVEPPRA